MDITEARMKETGRRIRACRKELKLTQAQLLEKLGLSPDSLGTMRHYEQGTVMPDLETLYKMCELFSCDIGYLTGEFPTKRYVVADISRQTGLSPKSVGILKNWATEGQKAAIDVLLADTVEKNGRSRPVLSSISRYMNFPKMEDRIYIDEKGRITLGDSAGGGEVAEGSLFVPASSTVLDSATIEDTILLEIQSALISLKKNG